ncbi:MAG TPA: hypothetical protein VK787_13935 [Puia sp.]|jgi:hypothetical protein|nr:hypothetical protein [Puia sp.]
MKKGSVQLCFLIVAITSAHTAKILQNSSIKVQDLPLRKIKSTLLLTKFDSLATTAKNGVFNVSFHAIQ